VLTQEVTSTRTETPSPAVPEPLRKRFSGDALSNAKCRVIAVTFVATLGLILRVHGLSEKSFWLDEIWSFTVARMPGGFVFWSMQHQDPNASLYYLILHYWMHIGQSEFAIRLFSALAGAATIPFVYALGKRLFSGRLGLIACVLFAANLYAVEYSQEARGYSLVVLLVTLSSLFFVRAIQKPTAGNWLWYVAFSSLAIYVHVFAVLAVAAQFVSIMLLPNKEIGWRRILPAFSAVTALSLPLAFLMYERMRSPFVDFGWLPRPTLRRVYDLFYALSGNASYYGMDPGKAPGGKFLLVIFFVAAAVGAVALVKTMFARGRSIQTWRLGFLLSWLLVPIALTLAVSLLGPSMFINRYLLICVPALVLIVAAGVDQIERTKWVILLVAAMVTIQALGYRQYFQYRSDYREWRAATDYLLTMGRPGDAIVFSVAHGRLLFDYYDQQYHPAEVSPFSIVYPDLKGESSDPRALSYYPALSSDAIASLRSRYNRVWLVVYPDDRAPASEISKRLRSTLLENHSFVNERHIDQVIVELYSRSAGQL
jgi:mannosyltransferase